MGRLIRAIAIGIAILAGSTTSGFLNAQDFPVMNMRLAHYLPAHFPGSVVDQWWADEIEKRSGGKIKTRIFWSESLGKSTELLDLVASGSVDLAATAHGFFPAQLPLNSAPNSIMFAFDSNEQAARINTELVEKNKAMQDELRKANVRPLFFHSLAGMRPFCRKKLETMADFKGTKIRSWGEYVPIMWKALNATPVNMQPSELYEGLQRGTVDCVFWPHDLIYAQKLYEVAKFAWGPHLGALPTWPIWVNEKKWQEWPPHVRTLFETVSREAAARDIKAVQEAESKALKEMVDKHGVVVVDFKEFDKLKAAIPDMVGIWQERMKVKGLGSEAQEIGAYWRQRRSELTPK